MMGVSSDLLRILPSFSLLLATKPRQESVQQNLILRHMKRAMQKHQVLSSACSATIWQKVQGRTQGTTDEKHGIREGY